MKITQTKINKFKVYLFEEEKSKNTIEKYLRDVIAFAKWASDKALSKQTVLEYKDHLLSQDYAPRSINSVLSSLNSFFECFNLYNLKVKMLKIQQQIFANESRELTKDEYDRLLAAALSKGNEQLYLLMQTICGTGIRVSELSAISVEALKAGQALINLKGKMRVIIIPEKLCKRLLQFAKKNHIACGSVFITKKGKPLDRTYIWRLMRSLCEMACVAKEKVFPHNFRHLFARTYYSVQKDIVRLADILGHSNVNTTRIYTKESGIVHRLQIQKLGLLHL